MPARIVFLDDNQDLRELMRDVLESSLKVECTCFGSVMEFTKNSEEVLRANVAILDINLGPNVPNGMDAFQWLTKQRFQGKIVFFTGHARIYLQAALDDGTGPEILEKPVDLNKLISVVQRAINGTP
jgi:FixJ family two-component response regulator